MAVTTTVTVLVEGESTFLENKSIYLQNQIASYVQKTEISDKHTNQLVAYL